MKLKKWLKYLDPIGEKIRIYTDKHEKAVFVGDIWDIPKKYKNMKIGRAEDDGGDEPIFITHFTNEHGVVLDCITINLIEK